MAEHWTENHPGREPELLERYTLGQLPATDRSAIDAHLRDCAECRQALEEELRLAAGVRRMARAQLKERIAGRLLMTPAFAVPWPRIAAAAAILVIAGVGVIGIWIQTREPDTVSPPATEQSYAADHDRARTEPQAAPPRSSAEGKDIGKSARSISKEESRPIDAGKDHEKATQPSFATPDAAGAPAGDGVWTEGIVSEEPTLTAGAVRQDEREKSRPAALEMQTNAARKSAAIPGAQEQQVVLTQQPSRLLQNRQQGMQQQATNSIPTLARQVGNQLNLTLYPDSLFPENELQQATVYRQGNDSLLIQVGNQQIRYRLPSSLLQQRNAR